MNGRDLYAAERARQIAAQSRSRPRDPHSGLAGGPAGLVRLAVLVAPCFCGHPLVWHQTENKRDTWCSVATGEGRCGCEAYRRAHDWGPDGSEEKCSACGVHVLDAAGPCPGKDQR